MKMYSITIQCDSCPKSNAMGFKILSGARPSECVQWRLHIPTVLYGTYNEVLHHEPHHKRSRRGLYYGLHQWIHPLPITSPHTGVPAMGDNHCLILGDFLEISVREGEWWIIKTIYRVCWPLSRGEDELNIQARIDVPRHVSREPIYLSRYITRDYIRYPCYTSTRTLKGMSKK